MGLHINNRSKYIKSKELSCEQQKMRCCCYPNGLNVVNVIYFMFVPDGEGIFNEENYGRF